MPSPAGHLIAGLTIAWAAEAVDTVRRQPKTAGRPPAAAGSRAFTPLVLACALLALAPDVDILLASHRTFTHSLGAVVAAAVGGGAIARALGSRGLASAVTCGLVVASHIVLDWLGRDSNTPRGVMAFWPASSAYFYSGIDLFAEVSRRYWKPDEFILKNAVSVAREILILGPVAAAAFWLRRRRLSRVSRGQFSSEIIEPRIPSPESRT
jgi:hypothetical protein